MVTIKQKLSVFSKLLHQSMEIEYDTQMKKLDDEYKKKIEKSRNETDIKVNKILNKAKTKSDTQLAENNSRSSISLKKESVSVKEKYYNVFMQEIYKSIQEFIKSDKYKKYLSSVIDLIFKENKFSNNLVIYMTNSDTEKYRSIVKDKITDINKNFRLQFKKDNDMIGGIIVEDIDGNYRINMSIQSILEENEPYIINLLYKELDKVGEFSDR